MVYLGAYVQPLSGSTPGPSAADAGTVLRHLNV